MNNIWDSLVSIDNLVYDAMGLDEEVDVHGGVDIPEEVPVHGDQEFPGSVVLHWVPYDDDLLLYKGQVCLALQL